MPQLCRKLCHFNIKKRILLQVSILRRYLNSLWKRFLACWIGKSSVTYRQLPTTNTKTAATTPATISSSSSPLVDPRGLTSRNAVSPQHGCRCNHNKDSSDLVSLKISLLGDSQIGKTSFLTKYAGREKGLQEFAGINQVDKTLCVKGAHISYTIWEVTGKVSCMDDIPVVCKDSVALLFMFDLTSRCTLNNIFSWFQQAGKWNQTAIPVIIGTKFDDFVQLPIDLQWTIASEARAYAKMLNATLFFSSATYNINVNKVFKFIAAKLFNLPWNLEKNLTVGEPIIDFY